ncbi:hypothetical protein [Listeria booriae]|uniref:hypothetical protein n=1 Tax=Listeria booriae TaxID=1552123 RepID=UPI0021AB1FFD|nr:hypothetical protein [Listeria booriae]
MKKFKKAATKSVKQIQKNIKKAYKKAKHTIVKKVNKIKKTIKRTAQSIKQIGTKALSKAKSKVKALGKATKAATHASKLVMAKAKKQKAAEKAARKAKAYQALCKNKDFLESQNKGFSDPTYDSKAGYPKPGEVWAFDANGNIDKKKSEELSKKLGDWSTTALMLVIPGPEEILFAGILAKAGGKVGIKVISKAGAKVKSKAEKKVIEELYHPVLDGTRTGSALKKDAMHSFNDIVDNYARYAKEFSLPNKKGHNDILYQIEGSKIQTKQTFSNSKGWNAPEMTETNEVINGIYEWVVDPTTGNVTHRTFIPGGKVTGKINLWGGK